MMSMRFFICCLMICLLGSVIAACGAPPAPEQPFDLKNPLAGWYRFVDPVGKYAIWLPGDWTPVVIQNAPDVTGPTNYHPKNDPLNGFAVFWIEPIDFLKDPHEPLLGWRKSPDVTYTLSISFSLSIPCARYMIGANQINHSCVIGPYTIGQLYHTAQVYAAFRMTTDPKTERDIELIWRLMVKSFALEQPPGTWIK